MKKKMFKDLQEDERRGKLFLALVLKTKGKISEAELTNIVNTIDIDKQYRINTYDNSKEFARNVKISDFDVETHVIDINDDDLTINIYLPEGEAYMISKRVQYILDNFDIKRKTANKNNWGNLTPIIFCKEEDTQ